MIVQKYYDIIHDIIVLAFLAMSQNCDIVFGMISYMIS